MGIFDLFVFKVILESFSALVSKRPVSGKRTSHRVKQTEILGVWGNCNMYMGYIWPFSVYGHFGVSSGLVSKWHITRKQLAVERNKKVFFSSDWISSFQWRILYIDSCAFWFQRLGDISGRIGSVLSTKSHQALNWYTTWQPFQNKEKFSPAFMTACTNMRKYFMTATAKQWNLTCDHLRKRPIPTSIQTATSSCRPPHP